VKKAAGSAKRGASRARASKRRAASPRASKSGTASRRAASPSTNGAHTLVRPAAVGSSPARLEGHTKVTGAAHYLDDLNVPGVLHGRTVRSTIARGRIKSIVMDPAFDWSGVVVADHRDIPGENVVALITDDQPLLAADEVRHWDEPILLLAHESAERAEAATRAVRIEYEPLDPVLTIDESLAKKALLFGDDNIFKEILIERGNLAEGFAAADLVVEGEYRCGHQEQLYIENNAMLAEKTANGGMHVSGSLQCPYYIHRALERIFKLPSEKVRVTQTVTGGGFGGKEEYPSMIGGHAALLAWKSGRPVKIVYDRLEDIAATTKRHPARMRMKAGVKRDGTLVALDMDVVMDGGAYLTLTPVVLSRGAIHAAGPYRWPNVRIRARGVATNTPPNGAFRGFGAPQTEFALECHLDRIAVELGMDPVTLRARNAVVIGDVTPTGQVLTESVGAIECLQRTVKRSNYAKKRRHIDRDNTAAERAEAAGHVAPNGRRLRRGIGLSLVYHGAGFTGSGEVKLASLAAMDLTPDGVPRVLSASTEIGQGTVTLFAQMAAEGLGVAPADVLVENPDTSVVPDSGPTVASRTVMVVGGLVAECAVGMRERLELFAERPIQGGADLRRVAKKFLAERGALRVERRYRKPPEISWDDDHYKGDAYGVFSYAACTVEVEVDLDTFETRVLHVTTAQDIGKAIHPVLAAGQIEGGTLQGLGWALLEEVRWKDGRVWNHQLTNYIIPTSADAPTIDTEIVEIPYSHGPFGAKGVGELPMDAPAPAVVAAVAHATGAWVAEIPITPERLRHEMEGHSLEVGTAATFARSGR
jgi:CO/xanthine dehydrogenase Mo-binding subunit